MCYLSLATIRRFDVSSIFIDVTEDAPFYDFKTYPYFENQVTKPEESPATILPLLITAIEVG